MINRNKLRLLLIGKTGHGKSTTGNTILGEERFPTVSGFCNPSEKCGWGYVSMKRRTIEVIDTPGLFDTYPDTKSVHREFVKCVCLTVPGPHAILFVVRADCRFTREDYFMYEDMKSLLGENMTRHLILVFTGISQEDFEKEYQEISRLPPELIRILHEAGGRVVCFSDTRQSTPSRKVEVERLLSSIRYLRLSPNEETFYSNKVIRCLHDKILQKSRSSNITIHEIKKSIAEETDLCLIHDLFSYISEA